MVVGGMNITFKEFFCGCIVPIYISSILCMRYCAMALINTINFPFWGSFYSCLTVARVFAFSIWLEHPL